MKNVFKATALSTMLMTTGCRHITDDINALNRCFHEAKDKLRQYINDLVKHVMLGMTEGTAEDIATKAPINEEGIMDITPFSLHRFMDPSDVNNLAQMPSEYDVDEDTAALIAGRVRYQQAADFMLADTNALLKIIDDHTNQFFDMKLKPDLQAARLKYQNDDEIPYKIDELIFELQSMNSQYLAKMITALTQATNDHTLGQKFMACYNLLASCSYRDSLGGLEVNEVATLAARDKIINDATLHHYQITSATEAAQALAEMLQVVSHTPEAPKYKVLTAIINRSLYCEGMWALHDFMTHLEGCGYVIASGYWRGDAHCDLGTRTQLIFMDQVSQNLPSELTRAVDGNNELTR